MKDLAISLLGTFQATLEGRPITDFGTDKARALLAYLAVEANRPHRRDALAGLLWPNSPQARARQSLRQALSQLRQAIGDPDRSVPFVLVGRETIQLNPESDYRLDVAEFATLGETSRAHRHRRLENCLPCMKRMEEMAGLYAGEFLAGFYPGESYGFDEWVTLQRECLQREAMAALAALAGYYERRGDRRRAIEATLRQVQYEPWREEAHRHLMRLLARDGQRSAALAQYQACQRALAEELGVEPTAETTALYEQIRDQGVAGSRRPVLAPAPARHNLPAAPTPFVGREKELAELAELLANPGCRLVTVVGPGGMGKTRLALQAAGEQVGLFAQGVAMVPLAALESAELLVPAIGEALGFRFHREGEPAQQLADLVREKELLLILDNMEHLPAGSGLVARILRSAPNVIFLVTSRERLNLYEEWVYEIEGLTHPADPAAGALESFDAVALFAQTARRGQHRFSLTEREARHVVRICQLVEGLPLAVELAASWVPVRTCEEIAGQIESNLDALATPLQNVPERHRSLRAAFEHSWSLLGERERAAFGRVGIFQGGFKGDAASHVAGASAEVLDSLVDKSLLRRNASGRYEMHRLLQQYAAERLDDEPEVRRAVEERHSNYFAGLLREREAWLRGERQAEALAAIAAEIENVRLAWRLAVKRRNVTALGRALASLGTFYAIRSWHQEGATAFGQAAESLTGIGPGEPAAGQREVVLGALLAWQGHFIDQLGRHAEARQLLTRSLEIVRGRDAPRELAFSLHTLAQIVCYGLNDYPAAGQLFGESLAVYESLGDAYGQAQALDGLGDLATRQGEQDRAREYYEAALGLRRRIGDRWGVSGSLGSLGGLAGRLGRYAEARQWFEESLAIGRELENPRGVAACLHNLSTVAYLQEDYAEARRLRRETLEICREIGYRWGITSALKSLGDVACRLGAYNEAQSYLRESLALLEESGDRRSQAYTLNSLGMVMQASGDQQGAVDHFRQALQAAMDIQEPALALDVLGSMARLASQAGETATAIELVAMIFQHAASEQQTRAQLEPLRAELAGRLPASEVAAAEARGMALGLEGIVGRVLGGQ